MLPHSKDVALSVPEKERGWKNCHQPLELKSDLQKMLCFFIPRYEMWICVFVSVLMIGGTFGVIYKVYLKILHPDVKLRVSKFGADFIMDSYGALVQAEPPFTFNMKATCSSGN